MKIAVIYSLPTQRARESPFIATEEDTQQSAQEVAAALRQKGARPFLVPVSEDALESISHLQADCVFDLIEWTGLDLPLSLEAIGRLEALGIPYTGADRANFETTSDKVRMKEALDLAGLPTPRWQLFSTGAEPVRKDLTFPVIMKLAWEHCSIGLTRDAVVTDARLLSGAVRERIRLFTQPVYAEEFIGGRELQVTLLEKTLGLTVLPPAEIVYTRPDALPFLTYEGRWQEQHPDFKATKVVVAQLPEKLSAVLNEISTKTFVQLGIVDYARLDLRLRGEEIFILEANSNPGLGDDEEYGMTVSYKAAGMTFADFVWEIVSSCLRRFKSPTA